jgi:hypothetical protein
MAQFAIRNSTPRGGVTEVMVQMAMLSRGQSQQVDQSPEDHTDGLMSQ